MFEPSCTNGDTVVHPDIQAHKHEPGSPKMKNLSNDYESLDGDLQHENSETSTFRHKKVGVVLLFVLGVVAHVLLFKQQCQGDEKLMGNRCIPTKGNLPVKQQLPEVDWKAEKTALEAIFTAYSETYPKKSDMHLPQLFPKKAGSPEELKEQLFTKGNVIRLEDRHHHSEAYEKVQRMVEKLRRGENVTIAAIGGSPTARGEFMYRVADFLKALKLKGHVNTINMGHGAQDGNHAAFLLDEFLPPNADLVIWEFSINDAWGTGTIYHSLSDEDKIGLSYLPKRNLLHMLGNSPSRPPVVMVYLWPKWKVPHNYIVDHGSFPFLLGSVDMKELKRSFPDKSDRLGFTIHDNMHPSLDGDLIIGEMLKRVIAAGLLSELDPPSRPALRSQRVRNAPLDPFKVTCIPGNQEHQARFQEFIDFFARETSFPRSWSVVEPTLGTSFQLKNSQAFPRKLVTKTSSSRHDKRFVIHVPLCNSEKRIELTMDPEKDRHPHRASKYLAVASEKTPYHMTVPNQNYELLELTLVDSAGREKVLKSPNNSWDQWELDGKPVETVHGPGLAFACGLQMGRAFKLDIPDFHISSVSICTRGEMTVQWLSVID